MSFAKVHEFKLGEERLYSPVLSIESMDRHKGGVYICSADNGVGKPAQSQVVLHVLCKCLIFKLLANVDYPLNIDRVRDGR